MNVRQILKKLINEKLLISTVPAATAALGKYVGIHDAKTDSDKSHENLIKKDFAIEYSPTNLIPICFGARSFYDTYKNWSYLTTTEKLTVSTLLVVGTASTVYALSQSTHEQTLMTQGSTSSFGALLFHTASAVSQKNNSFDDQTSYQDLPTP